MGIYVERKLQKWLHGCKEEERGFSGPVINISNLKEMCLFVERDIWILVSSSRESTWTSL